jgi:hypothetical protein
MAMINPSTSRPEGRGLLRVDPERRFFIPALKVGLGAVEWVNLFLLEVPTIFTPLESPSFKAGMIRERMIAPLRAEYKPIPF